ncbi:MAG: efflux RND transporter periplasmic adaptor subunit [Gammaproteobacteria bacterium]|nr:MAG: efflux RND transporter periplasmic adaptor subunit [Gammaproteobacteria bacterium]
MKGILWKLGAIFSIGFAQLGIALAGELETAGATVVEVPRVYQLDGTVEAVNASTVGAQTSGQVKEVRFDVDDLVKAGSVIVVIDDTQQRAALAQAQANLRQAQAQLADAEKEYNRIRKVFARNAVSKAVMDKTRAARDQARAAVAAARAAVIQAQQQLEYTRVKAPYTGIVTERQIEVGEVVAPGTPLMSGISLERLRVNVDVPQSLVEAVRTQRRGAVLIGKQWVPARKVTVFPVADPTTDTFKVRMQLPSGVKGVYPGMYLKAALEVGKRNVLVVPPQAVVFRSEVVGVYVVDDEGRVSLRHIRLGKPLVDGRFVVLSGLSAGERVAIDPQAAVRELIAQRRERASHEG